MRSTYHYNRMSETEWRAAVAAKLAECERDRLLDVDALLSTPLRAPMSPLDRKRLQKQAALHLLTRSTEAA